MATVALTETIPIQTIPGDGRLKFDGSQGTFGDWRDDLIRDGYAVVKGAIPKDRALNYADRMFALLESL
jgi:hypothetical protein